MATIYSHPRNREEKKRLEIGITQKYIRAGTNWDVYKRPLYFLRRVWWCLSHYHWTLHFRCSVKEMIISLNLAISTAVMAMKLQVSRTPNYFAKDKLILYIVLSWLNNVICLLTHLPLKKNWKNAHNIVHMDTSIVPLFRIASQSYL